MYNIEAKQIINFFCPPRCTHTHHLISMSQTTLTSSDSCRSASRTVPSLPGFMLTF